ncbi:MAG: hypothetical protein K6F03_10470 [Saccharofermentans sp.]|nr:hypothetical protein [Saccharofermentans sp.]
MNRSKSVFIEIFKFYEVNHHDEKEKQTMRKFIRYNLRKEFPNFDWSDTDNWYELPVTERVGFMCDNKTIRTYFLERSRLTESSLKKKIKEEKEKHHIEERARIKQHNDRIEFKKSLDAVMRYANSPDRDKRIVSYVKALVDFYNVENAALEAEIDHIALRALFKFLENEYSIVVDLQAIEEYLRFKREWMNNKNTVLKENDENIRLAEALKKLENLDFVKKS